jgi:hypothetical protein
MPKLWLALGIPWRRDCLQLASQQRDATGVLRVSAEETRPGANGAASSAATPVAASSPMQLSGMVMAAAAAAAIVSEMLACNVPVCRGQESASRHTYSGYYKSSSRAISLTLAETVMPLQLNSLPSCLATGSICKHLVTGRI